MKKDTFVLLFCSLFVLISCKEANNEPVKLQGLIFGTTYNIIYYDAKIDFSQEINQLFDDVNHSISTYIDSSDISRINRGENGFVVDAYFKEVFFKSERIFKETNGYFDPTVGDLVNAWGFGPEAPLNNLDSLKVKELMNFVGFDNVEIKNDKVYKKYPETYFDFNSIGKGFGLDIVARFLDSKDITNYLVLQRWF